MIGRDGTGYRVLHKLNNPALFYDIGLVDVSGKLFGPDSGGVFRIDEDGTHFTEVHTFTDRDEYALAGVEALVDGGDGYIYGEDSVGPVYARVIFRFNINGGDIENCYAFVGDPPSSDMPSGLLRATDGTIWGIDAGRATIFNFMPLP